MTRGLDPLWIEKMEGDGKMKPAEPLADIHMPNNSILPFLISSGFTLASFGFIYQLDGPVGRILIYIGMAFAIGCMIIRSLKDDHGYNVTKEELEKEGA